MLSSHSLEVGEYGRRSVVQLNVCNNTDTPVGNENALPREDIVLSRNPVLATYRIIQLKVRHALGFHAFRLNGTYRKNPDQGASCGRLSCLPLKRTKVSREN